MNQTQNHTEVNVQSPNPTGMAQFEIYVPQRLGYPQMQPQMYPQINLQQAILHEQLQTRPQQADPTLCVVVHILVALAPAYFVYTMYESDVFSMLHKYVFDKNPLLDALDEADHSCWRFFYSYYLVILFAAGFSVWTLLSLVWFYTDCERDLCCWTFIHTAIIFGLVVMGGNTKTSACSAGYALMRLFVSAPREPRYVFWGLCVGNILLIITGKMYVSRKLQALRREQERKKLEAMLLVK